MSFPFSREAFFDLFARYNEAVWPAQLILLVAAASPVALMAIGRRRAQSSLGWILAFLWAWMAVAYHFVFFTRINPAAWVFGLAFIASAFIFAKHARAGTLCFEWSGGEGELLGLALVLYALVGYPLVGSLVGHAYPRIPTFGLPCPTTIFTLGVLLLARQPVPRAVFVVPFAWSFVGSAAAFQLGVVQDFGLLAAALITGSVLVMRVWRMRAT